MDLYAETIYFNYSGLYVYIYFYCTDDIYHHLHWKGSSDQTEGTKQEEGQVSASGF